MPALDAGPSLDVSVVVPVYNEAGHVDAEVSRIRSALEASSYTFEVLVVDDGSTDGSCDEMVEDAVVRVIRLPRNQGSGAARRAGTSAARGDVVVWTDADMTYPNDRIPELVKELEGYDQVVGARTSEQGTSKELRSVAKWLIRALASYLTRIRIPDLNSGFRAFRRDVAHQYLHHLPAGFSCVTTITMTFLAGGYDVKWVPIEYSPRSGRSKFHWWSDTRRYLLQVVRLVLSYDPLRVFLPVAAALVGIGSCKLAYDLVVHDARVATNTLLVLFAGMQLAVVGMLADLVVRVTRPSGGAQPAAWSRHPREG